MAPGPCDMEAEVSQDLQFEGLMTFKLVKVEVQRQKRPTSQFKDHQAETEGSLWLRLLLYSGLQWIGQSPPALGRAICLRLSIQILICAEARSQAHPESWLNKYLGSLGPSQVDEQN